MRTPPASLNDRTLFSGLIPLHVLYHACKGPIFGLEMIEELARHGYRLSPGTIYPVLHGLERQKLLKSRKQLHNGRIRRVYRGTPRGARALQQARQRVAELLAEILADETGFEQKRKAEHVNRGTKRKRD